MNIDINDEMREVIIERVVQELKQDIWKETIGNLEEVIRESIASSVQSAVQVIVMGHLDTEFTPVDKMGRRGETTTVRDMICDALEQECTFNPHRDTYKRNGFTKAIMSVVDKEVVAFTKEHRKIVTHEVIKECHEVAAKRLREMIKA